MMNDQEIRACCDTIERIVTDAVEPDAAWVIPVEPPGGIEGPERRGLPFAPHLLDHVRSMRGEWVIEDAADCRGATDAAGMPSYRSFAGRAIGESAAVILAAEEPGDVGIEELRSLDSIMELFEVVLSDAATGQTSAEQRLDEIRRILSHDMGQPIAIARGNLDLVREGGESERLETVDSALERISQLVQELESLATTGRRSIDAEPVDVDGAARQAWTSCSDSTAALEIETDRSVLADRNSLVHVFENLFRNAVQAGAATVTVGAIEHGVYVEDDGPGIPSDLRDSVFEPGFSTKTGHTGDGLRIVADVVEANGWKISVASGVADGTRFEITGLETRSSL